MFKKFLKSLQISFLFWLKKIGLSFSFICGQVEIEHYVAKTGETIYTKLPMGLVNFNTVDDNLKNALAALISTTGNARWIGVNGLIADQGAATGKDGIGEENADYPYITTKDSGGTGSQSWVKFKGVRTAAGAESHTQLELGLNWDGDAMTTPYAAQTISKTLAAGDILTIYWTLTAA